MLIAEPSFRGGTFVFSFNTSPIYPHEAPKVKCKTKCYRVIKLFKVKEKQREAAENANGKPPGKKQSAGELRLHKGFIFD
ncbi:hypothetical protein OROGR_012004 [Orobanche gracilis]